MNMVKAIIGNATAAMQPSCELGHAHIEHGKDCHIEFCDLSFELKS